jgi:glycogen debranching enzyme
MPIDINVGPPLLNIHYGSTFMVTDPSGTIADDSSQGVFYNDTRVVNYYAVFANGQPWIKLTSSTPVYYGALIHLVNPAFQTEDGEIPQDTLALVIGRSVSEGIHEDFDLTNYGLRRVRFNLEIALRSDFADIFEVKSRQFVRRGRIQTRWDDSRRELWTSYVNGDFHRVFVYRVNSQSPPVYANGRVTFEIGLEPGAAWHSCFEYALGEQEPRSPSRACPKRGEEKENGGLEHDWMAQAPGLHASNEDLHRLYRRSVEDIGALRMFSPPESTGSPHSNNPPQPATPPARIAAQEIWVPSAGVPWFVALFGRDSLIASLQNMLVNTALARGTLEKLAEFQATEFDDWRDAEPGKILHEVRFGELAYFHRIPHTPYYGTADATPLYLIALHETWKWTGDDNLLRKYRDAAERCLSWIDHYGDLDGDGFQEYRTRSSRGYENMGWKDSGDAIVDPGGAQVRQPKALCELQGYVFDAWMRMAEVYEHLGESERARDLMSKASAMRERFERRFWCEDAGFYALTLDPDKRPVATIASNAGHLLWSGIAGPDRAASVVRRLKEPDMWSGWGIRTLSARNPAYNPYSYQRGSVWPHDNGIIALGFKRYGFGAEAARVAHDIFAAANAFASYRLPELYAGIQRQPGGFPIQYLGANVPQAWAAGSVFHCLQAIIGLQADAPRQTLYVDPELPEWIPELAITALRVGAAKVDLHFRLHGGITKWKAKVREGPLKVEQKHWEPWRTS